MSSSLKRLRVGLVVLVIIFLVAVLGYRLAGWEWIEAVYMVVVTLSTVGYKEAHDLSGSPGLQLFTILVIIFGVSTALYIVGGLVQMMAEGEINRALGVHRATREINRLSGHTVICGFGRVGEILAQELKRHRKPFVVVESEPERINDATSQDYLVLHHDATEEDALRAAGVDRASTLVTTLPRDADNVFITLTARNLNPKLVIIARGEFPSTEKKLLQAGADRVVLPAAAGALRMAAMVTRPAALELIEVVAGRQIAEVEVDELTIPEGSPLVGMSVGQSQTRTRHGLLIVAFRRGGGKLEFNPGGDAVFESGASVVVMGRPDDIDRFRAEYQI
jgi:voltage-gated potassium channel